MGDQFPPSCTSSRWTVSIEKPRLYYFPGLRMDTSPENKPGRQAIRKAERMDDSRSKFEALRGGAEELLKAGGVGKSARIPATDVLALVDELEVHQVELEMQNEELRAAKAALEISRARYYGLYDQAPVGYCTLSPKGRILEANLTAANLLGKAREDLPQLDFSRLIHEEDLSIYHLHLERLFENNRRQVCELRLLREEAEPFWADLESTLGRDADDAPVCCMVMRDITERRSDGNGRARKEMLEKVFESAPHIMLLVDKDVRVAKINRTCAAFSGRSKEEVVGLLGGEVFNCLNAFHKMGCGRNSQCSDCPVRSRVAKTFKTRQNILDAEGNLRIRRGRTDIDVHIIISTVLIENGGTEFVLLTIADMTERTRAQEALRKSEEGLRELAGRLQEANTALKVLLDRRKEDRTELEQSLLKNVNHLIGPCLDTLKKSRLSDEQRDFLEILECNLREITSPFAHKMSARTLGLTPMEIRVADLIRQGKSSKEIADLLRVSERAAIFHRQGIRGKLGLKGRKINLQTYLQTLEQL